MVVGFLTSSVLQRGVGGVVLRERVVRGQPVRGAVAALPAGAGAARAVRRRRAHALLLAPGRAHRGRLSTTRCSR